MRRGVAALLVPPLIVLAGCQGDPVAGPTTTAEAPGAAVALPSAAISTIPAGGARKVRPDAPVLVTALNGKLTNVRLVPASGSAVRGTIGTDQTSWQSASRLQPNASYTLIATALGRDGKIIETRAAFRTLKPSDTLGIKVSPTNGETVGVGMPLVVRFDAPVSRWADVERSLQVTASRPVEGAWHWISSTEVHYRPKEYWPAYSTVTLRASLRGVDAGNGTWGTANRTVSYEISRSMVSKIDTDAHRLRVYRDGTLIRTVPITAGQEPDYTTRSGVKVVLFKDPYRNMTGTAIGIPRDDPDYYDLDVYWTIAVTASGEFVHAAPWSAASHGWANVSHGCVGMSTVNGKWLYDHTMRGDVVVVTGTSRKMELRNGFGDWNLSWSDWLEGSALH